MKKNLFLDINDGSTSKCLQVVTERSDSMKPAVGDSVEVLGEVSQAPQGNAEIKATTLNILCKCDIKDGYPFTPRQVHPPEYVREYLHLRPKVDKFAAVLRVRHWATKYINDYFIDRDFLHIHTPVLTSNDCEGAGEVTIFEKSVCDRRQ